MKITKAILPLAGAATRFLPFSKAVGKHFLPIVDRPAIQILVEQIAATGIEEIFFVVSPHEKILPKYFSADENLNELLRARGKSEIAKELKKLENCARFFFVEQNAPRGDGDAVLRAAEKFENESFAVFFADDLIFGESPPEQLLRAFEKNGKTVVGVQKVPETEVGNFGIVRPDRDGEHFQILDFAEKPAAQKAFSNLAVVGKYVCAPEVVDALKNCARSADGELRLADAFQFLLKNEGEIFGQVLNGERFDLGNPRGFLAANFFAARRKGIDF